MAGKPVTIKDVASLAGVSAGTVSNVLGGQKAVRPASRESVLKAVESLGYTADLAAAYLRTGRSRVIAAVVPSLENPFFTAFVAAVERLCQDDGYELIVASSEGSHEIENKRMEALAQWRPAGYFIMPTGDTLGMRAAIEETSTPYVVADRRLLSAGCDFIEIDNVEAGCLAANHLIKLGHQKLVVFAASFDVINIKERLQGIRSSLYSAGLDAPMLMEIPESVEGEKLEIPQHMREATAGIALTNFTTLQVLGGLMRSGMHVPAEVSLVGFDDYVWMSVAAPSITAVRQPIQRMGEEVWRSLLARIRGQKTPAIHKKFSAELVVRESTAPRA